MERSLDYYSGLTFSLGGSSPLHLEWHRHVPTYYGIQYNHAGRLRVRVDGKVDVSMEGPCAFISHPGAFFEYGTGDGRPRHHNFVCFFGPRVQRYIEGGLLKTNSANPLVKIGRPQSFFQSLVELGMAVNSRGLVRMGEARMVATLESLLLQIAEPEDLAAPETAGVGASLGRLLQEIERDPAKSWDFVAEAGRLSCTEQHFRRVFKKAAGMPPRQYLIEQRLRLASELLLKEDVPVAEIGSLVGIDDEHYFSRLFRRRFSVPPLKYRKEFQGHLESEESPAGADGGLKA